MADGIAEGKNGMQVGLWIMIKCHEDLDIRRRPNSPVILLLFEMSNGILRLAAIPLGAESRSFQWSPFNAIEPIVGSEDDELMLGFLSSFSEFEPVDLCVGIMSIDFVIYRARWVPGMWGERVTKEREE